MGIKVITDVADELIPLAALRTRCRITAYGSPTPAHPDDALLMELQAAAREWVEGYTARSFCPKTLELSLDAFPEGAILLPRGPVTSIVSLKYFNEAGTEITANGSTYALDDYSHEHWLVPAVGTDWPGTRSQVNAVKVRYVAGFAANLVAADVKTAVAMVTAHLYDNRSETSAQKLETVPLAAKHLVAKYRVLGF